VPIELELDGNLAAAADAMTAAFEIRASRTKRELREDLEAIRATVEKHGDVPFDQFLDSYERAFEPEGFDLSAYLVWITLECTRRARPELASSTLALIVDALDAPSKLAANESDDKLQEKLARLERTVMLQIRLSVRHERLRRRRPPAQPEPLFIEDIQLTIRRQRTRAPRRGPPSGESEDDDPGLANHRGAQR
jgi:hypothetical protein